MAPHDFLSQLSQHLPNAVNGLTPNGRLPDEMVPYPSDCTITPPAATWRSALGRRSCESEAPLVYAGDP